MSAFTQQNSKASKLSASEVVEIRRLYLEGMTQGALCREFGVSIVTIGRIVRGETWQRLPVAEKPLSEGEMKESQARVLAMLAEDPGESTGLPPTSAVRIPPSPLDDERDALDESPPSGLSALQQRAAGYGMDIEKLLVTKAEEK